MKKMLVLYLLIGIVYTPAYAKSCKFENADAKKHFESQNFIRTQLYDIMGLMVNNSTISYDFYSKLLEKTHELKAELNHTMYTEVCYDISLVKLEERYKELLL